MVNKEIFRDVLIQYGLKYWELMNVADSFEKGERPEDSFFKCAVLPGRLYVEPTNRCNKNCIYCARSSMKRSFSDLSLEAFAEIVDKIPRGIYITLTGNGEPLLNKNIYSMIRKARSRGALIGLITNGTLLSEKNARELIESGPNRVQISFDAIDKKVYDLTYRTSGKALSYESVLAKILSFILVEREVYKKGIFLTISSVLTEEVKKVRDQSCDFWGKMPIDNYYEGPLLTLQTDSGLVDKRLEENVEPWKICSNPWVSMKINSDGTVNPCVHDFSSKYVIGNVYESSLEEIVNSEKAVALRKALFYKDVQFFKEIGYNCHKCNTWKSQVGHDIAGYLNNSYPITYGLMIQEIAGDPKNWTKEQMASLKEALKGLDVGGKGF